MFKKILLATDFSQCAEQLWHCVGELKGLGAQEILAVHIPPLVSGGRFEEYARKKLAGQIENVKEQGMQANVVVRTGPAPQEINALAQEEDVDLILVGAKGENRIREFFLGNTAWNLIRISEKPILVEKFKMLTDEKECAAVCERKFQRVLLPIDFSEDSLRIFSLVKDRLAKWVDEVILAHIVDQGSSREVIEKMKQEATDRLSALSQNMEDAGVSAQVRVRVGVPSRYIVQLAQDDAVTLVMMATRGAGSIKELLIGSTAENVARYSTRPVLLFPMKNA